MKNYKGNYLIWIILAVMGIFLIIGNGIAQDLICKVMAVGLLIAAIAGIAAWWRDRSDRGKNVGKLIGSVAFLGLGIWILIDTPVFLKVLNVALGFVIIVSGGISVYQGWKAGKEKLPLILGAVGIILGLVIACSNAAAAWVVILEGVGLVYTAITGFLSERKK